MSIQINVVRICGFRGIFNIEVILPRVTVLLQPGSQAEIAIESIAYTTDSIITLAYVFVPLDFKPRKRVVA